MASIELQMDYKLKIFSLCSLCSLFRCVKKTYV